MDAAVVHGACGSTEKFLRFGGRRLNHEDRDSHPSVVARSPRPFPSLGRSIVIPSADAALHSRALNASLPFHSALPFLNSSPFISTAPAAARDAVSYCCLSRSETQSHLAGSASFSSLRVSGWVSGLLQRVAEAIVSFYEPCFYTLPIASYEQRSHGALRLLTAFVTSIPSMFFSVVRLMSSVYCLFQGASPARIYPAAVALTAVSDPGGSSKLLLLAADGAHSERSCLLDGDGTLLLSAVSLSSVSPLSQRAGFLFRDTAESNGPSKSGVDSLVLLGHADASVLLRYSGKALSLESAVGCGLSTRSTEDVSGRQRKEPVSKSAFASTGDGQSTEKVSAQLGLLVHGSSQVTDVAFLPHGISAMMILIGYSDGRLECVCHCGSIRLLGPSSDSLPLCSPRIVPGGVRNSGVFNYWTRLWSDKLDSCIVSLRVSPRAKRVCVLTASRVFVFDPLIVLAGCPPLSSTKLSRLLTVGGEALLGHTPVTCCWVDDYQLVILSSAGRLTLLQRDPRRKAADLSCVCRARLDSQTRAVLRRQLCKSNVSGDKRCFSSRKTTAACLGRAVVPPVTLEFHRDRRVLYMAVRGSSRPSVVNWQMRPRVSSIPGGSGAVGRVKRLLFGRYAVLETMLAEICFPERAFVMEEKCELGLSDDSAVQPQGTGDIYENGGLGVPNHASLQQAAMIPRRPVLGGVLTFALGRDSERQGSYLAVIHEDCEAVAVYIDSLCERTMHPSARQMYNLQPHRACLSFWLGPPLEGCCPSAVAFCSFPNHFSESSSTPRAPVLLVQWSLLSRRVVPGGSKATDVTPAISCFYRLPPPPLFLQRVAGARWVPSTAGGCFLSSAGPGSLLPPRSRTDAELETYKTWKEASSVGLPSRSSVGEQPVRNMDPSRSKQTEGEAFLYCPDRVQRSDPFTREPNSISGCLDDKGTADRITAAGKPTSGGASTEGSWRPDCGRTAWQQVGTPGNAGDAPLRVSSLRAESSLGGASRCSDSTLKQLLLQQELAASPSCMSDWLIRWKLEQQRLAGMWRPNPERRDLEIPPAVPSPSFSRWAFPHRTSSARASPYHVYWSERNPRCFGMRTPDKGTMYKDLSYAGGRHHCSSVLLAPHWKSRTGAELFVSSSFRHEELSNLSVPTGHFPLLGQSFSGTTSGVPGAGVRTRLESSGRVPPEGLCRQDWLQATVAGGREVPHELCYGLGQSRSAAGVDPTEPSVGPLYPTSGWFTRQQQPLETLLASARLRPPRPPAETSSHRETPLGSGDSPWTRRDEATAALSQRGFVDRW